MFHTWLPDASPRRRPRSVFSLAAACAQDGAYGTVREPASFDGRLGGRGDRLFGTVVIYAAPAMAQIRFERPVAHGNGGRARWARPIGLGLMTLKAQRPPHRCSATASSSQ
jgi:hypothetical protein